MDAAAPQSCVAYYRVSTKKQEKSGLGLEAQQHSVREHLKNGGRSLVAEFTEIESGKKPDRPKLAEALKLCRLTGSKLIVASLDRLARNVAFVSRLMEAGADFEAVDFPQANRFTIHIMAAVAEYEGRIISERTRAGLAIAKAKGVKLGGRTGTSGNPAGLAKACQVIAAKSAARIADLAPVVEEIRAAGFVSCKAVARQLNARGIIPARGGRWSSSTASFVLSRLSLALSVSESKQAQLAAKQTWIAGLAPILVEIRGSGHKTLTSIARELNARGVPAFRGGRWIDTLLPRALMCLPDDQSQSIYSTRNQFASRLLPVIEEIQGVGKTGAYSIASELNARGISGLNGGLWRRAQVHPLLKRLSMVAKRRTMADWLPSLAPIITEIRAAGHLSTAAMASELNARGVRACLGGRWTMRQVSRALREMRARKIDYEPKASAASGLYSFRRRR
jgi:DNA invertase Pin-like site-specific DNA recombinase